MTSPAPLLSILPPATVAELRHSIAMGFYRIGRRAPDVLRYALENPSEVAFGSSRSVAKGCKVSPATLQKVVCGLGFSRFAEFRELFRRELRNRQLRTCLAPQDRIDQLNENPHDYGNTQRSFSA